jgi:TniQ protein
MAGFDLTEARLVRLRQDVEALLSNEDPQAREDIFRLLAIGTRAGLDLFPRFRAMVAPLLIPSVPHGRAGADASGGLEMEALPERQQATLWPYRPQRLRDELLSSWLCRVAQGLAAPPKRFAQDAIGAQLVDVDRTIDDAALDRLGFLSGQTAAHLMDGTLRPDIKPLATESRPRVHQAVALYGDLILQRRRGGQCVGPITQYCPVCLADSRTAYLRRGWRFSFEVVCWDDGCLLLDSCWRCGASVNPLAPTIASTEFLCAKCHARLADAPSVRMDEFIDAQHFIYAQIERHAFFCTVGFASPSVAHYLGSLAKSGLRGSNPAGVADRVGSVLQEWWRCVGTDRTSRRGAVRKR